MTPARSARHNACSFGPTAARNAELCLVRGQGSLSSVPGGETDRMKHATTREVFAYWDNCRGDRLAPERSDIEPGAIRSVLSDTFILTFDRKAGHPFRLAGTRLCAVMGCELKGEPFADLWSEESRKQIDDLLKTIAEETARLVARDRKSVV